MIKYFKYIFAAAIVMMAAVGCQDDVEDSFSTNPVAPVLTNNGSILLTQNTMSEDVVWAWKAARFLGETQYSLYAEYDNAQKIQIGASTTDLSVSMKKTAFQEALKGITGVPENTSFSLSFTVEATSGDKTIVSDKQVMTVFSYTGVVSSVISVLKSEIVLDMSTPNDDLQLIEWTAARFDYAESATYAVCISYEDGEWVMIANDLTGFTFTKTVDEWNEAFVSAGAPEGVASDIKFRVCAFSESFPDGVPSELATINATTYIATYPELLYLPGNYQGWDPATAATIAHSTLTKGLYEAYINLTTENGADVEFKFSPVPAWEGDFGGSDVALVTDGDGNVVVTARIGESGNIQVPSGFYRISMNKKFNTLTMVKIESMGIIGSATPGGWGEETPMAYDAETNTYSVVTTMTQGEEYKFRANNNWTYSIGDNGAFDGGANYVFAKETGEYKLVLDVNKHPYEVKLFSTSYPEKLYLPGSHQGWSPATAPTLIGNGEGQFEGGVNLVGDNSETCEFKFSPKPAWDGDFGGEIEWADELNAAGVYGVSSNIAVPSGYYYIQLDMTAGTFTLTRINKVGLIGSFNGWGGDEDFAYDATANVWTCTTALTATDEFKVRMNGDWAMNRGFAGPASVNVAYPSYNDGPNITVASDGTYTITLDMSVNPNTIQFTK